SGKTALAALFGAALGHLLVALRNLGVEVGDLLRERALVDLVGPGLDPGVTRLLGACVLRRLRGFARHATTPTRRHTSTNGRPHRRGGGLSSGRTRGRGP